MASLDVGEDLAQGIGAHLDPAAVAGAGGTVKDLDPGQVSSPRASAMQSIRSARGRPAGGVR
ncbi:hypothetical protein AB0G86_19090 [Streptomyces scabiei]|uniref:hypothetical protein n=1 Tax=Streptomyces scabiei TaxID=1930 RepID=UPI0033E2EC4C